MAKVVVCGEPRRSYIEFDSCPLPIVSLSSGPDDFFRPLLARVGIELGLEVRVRMGIKPCVDLFVEV